MFCFGKLTKCGLICWYKQTHKQINVLGGLMVEELCAECLLTLQMLYCYPILFKIFINNLDKGMGGAIQNLQ